jgi:hypothetical protein
MHETIRPALELGASGGSIEKTGEKNGRTHSQRNALLCALVVGACLLAIYPVAEMGIIDDWSYTKTALDFARTGHFLYNGWNTAILGWQIPWGALFIKLFGFSFTVVRLSTLPVAMASVYLFHQIMVRFEIAPRLAVFGALVLGLSPVIVPIAVRFMTDVPCLFVILLCIYMCQRAVAAASDRSALLWLCSAGLLNVAGGTVRQIAWLGALVMVPSTAWLLRRRRGMMAAGMVTWTASVAAIFWLMHWFNQQPYVWSESQFLSGSMIHLSTFVHLSLLLLYGLLCLALIVLPILAIWLPAAAILGSRARVRIGLCMMALIALYAFLKVHGSFSVHGNLESNIMPWLAMEVIPAEGIVSIRPGQILGSSIVTLGIWMRATISLIVVAAGLLFAEQMVARRWFLEAIREKQPYWRNLFWILGPFTFIYYVFLLPRSLYGFLFDRYLIPPMAVLIIVLLKLYQEEVALRVPSIGWVVLALFAFYTVAATHDQFALDRARVFATDRMMAAGIPRTEIEGGLEFDGWTQIEHGGHINEPFIRVPRGAYQPNVPVPPLAPDCQVWYSGLTPALRPKYFLAYEQMHCLAPSKYPAVGYRTWLPPFHRKVYIQQAPKNSD